MSETRQPFPCPDTFEDYLAARPRMIDTHGRALVLEDCTACRREHFTVEPCASAVPCPRCGARASRCRRPSGHDAAWHAERVAAFWRRCDELERAGLPQVARWPELEAAPPAPALFDWPAT